MPSPPGKPLEEIHQTMAPRLRHSTAASPAFPKITSALSPRCPWRKGRRKTALVGHQAADQLGRCQLDCFQPVDLCPEPSRASLPSEVSLFYSTYPNVGAHGCFLEVLLPSSGILQRSFPAKSFVWIQCCSVTNDPVPNQLQGPALSPPAQVPPERGQRSNRCQRSCQRSLRDRWKAQECLLWPSSLVISWVCSSSLVIG